MKTKIVLALGLVLAVCGVTFALPDGVSAATYTVTNTNDSGAGSLRQAIIDVTAGTGGDTIDFNIPGSGPHIITLNSALPSIVDFSTTIDGRTQSGAVCDGSNTRPMVAINFNNNAGLVLPFEASGSSIYGLAMYGAAEDSPAADIDANGLTFRCNFVGTVNGETFLSANDNSDHLLIGGSAGGITIGGSTAQDFNLISGRGWGNIMTKTGESAPGLTIQGNYIGTNIDGDASLGGTNSARYGIYFDEGDAIQPTIRNNVIAGQLSGAIMFYYVTGGTNSVAIDANKINTDVTGNNFIAADDSVDGIQFYSSTPNIGHVTIGGFNESDRNIIGYGGSGGYGIYVYEPNTVDIRNNYINTSANGNALLGTGTAGNSIQMYCSASHYRGIQYNVINGQDQGYGIQLNSCDGTIIVHNNIFGLSADQSTELSNMSRAMIYYNYGSTANDYLSFNNNVVAGIRDGAPEGVLLGAGNVSSFVGNSFGTDSTHTQDFGGTWSGVYVQNFGYNSAVIGGIDPEDGNYFNNLQTAIYSNYISGVSLSNTIVGTNAGGNPGSYQPINNMPPGPEILGVHYNEDDTTEITFLMTGDDFDAGDYVFQIYSNAAAINEHGVYDATNLEYTTTITKTEVGDETIVITVPSVVNFPTAIVTDINEADVDNPYILSRMIVGFTGTPTPVPPTPGPTPDPAPNNGSGSGSSTAESLASTGMMLQPLIAAAVTAIIAGSAVLLRRQKHVYFSAR